MQFKTRANLGVGCGIITMFIASAIAQQGPESIRFAVAAWLGGWALMIWGSVNYARWKGYSGWFGLMGYLLVPGLIILVCFPNKRKRMIQIRGSEPTAEWDALSEQDGSSGHRYLLTLVPLGALFVVVGGFLFFAQSNIDPAEWKVVAPPGAGFQALMPGTPQLEQTTRETPAGNVELQKLAVQPKGKKELFMIVSVRFPDEASAQLGGAEKLLELGRQDVLAACQGQLQSEKQIVLSDFPGLELEVRPPKGAVIKSRVFATNSRLYKVSVHVPKIRLASEDVEKFFDTFKLSPEASATADRAGGEPPPHRDGGAGAGPLQ